MAETMERKKLIENLPFFMQQFAEIKEIMQVENDEMDRIDANIQRTLENAFIEDCDEYGIKKYETLLGIVPTAEDTLDSRKSRVLVRWNDAIPYTYRTLIAKLNVLCGVNNYDVSGDLKRYELIITTHLSLIGQTKELENLLDRIVPVNMIPFTQNQLNYDLEGTVYAYGITVETRHFTINS